MHPHTREAIESIRDTASVLSSETAALRDHLSTILNDTEGQDVSDQITALSEALRDERAAHAETQTALDACREAANTEPEQPDLLTWRPSRPTAPTGVLRHPEANVAIRELIGGSPDLDWENDAAYSDHSDGIEFATDGAINFHFDPARRMNNPNTGGANWINAAMPLANPGVDVELKYTVICPGDFGKSVKLPGLSTVTGDQRAPGGGVAGKGQFINRPSFSDWNKTGQAFLGMYEYWPTKANPGEEVVLNDGSIRRLWHPERDTYALWWYADHQAEFLPHRELDVSLRCTREADFWFSSLILNGIMTSYRHPIDENSPELISHLAFVSMYGGNSPDYGPAGPTTVSLHDMEVITHQTA